MSELTHNDWSIVCTGFIVAYVIFTALGVKMYMNRGGIGSGAGGGGMTMAFAYYGFAAALPFGGALALVLAIISSMTLMNVLAMIGLGGAGLALGYLILRLIMYSMLKPSS